MKNIDITDATNPVVIEFGKAVIEEMEKKGVIDNFMNATPEVRALYAQRIKNI